MWLPAHVQKMVWLPLQPDDEVLEDLPGHEKASDPLRNAWVRRSCRVPGGGSKVFMGEVVEIEVGTTTGDRLYRIRYTDGDLQHLTAEEVKKCQCSKPVALLSQAASPPAKRQKVVAGTSLEPAAMPPVESVSMHRNGVPTIQSRAREPLVDARTTAAVEEVEDLEEELGMQEVSMVDDMQEVSMADDLQEAPMVEEPVAAEESTFDEAVAVEQRHEETLEAEVAGDAEGDEGLMFVGMGEEGEEPVYQQEDVQTEPADLGSAAQESAAGVVQDLIVLEDEDEEEDDLDFDFADAGENGVEQEVPLYGEEFADMAEEVEETPIPVTRNRSLTLQKNAVKTAGQAMMRPQTQAGSSSILGRPAPRSTAAPVEYGVEDREQEQDDDEAT